MTRPSRPAAFLGGVVVAGALLAGCSSGSADAGTAGGGTATPTSAPTGSPGQGGGRFGGPNSAQFAAIRQCLQAAGIPLPSFSPGARPSFSPGARPSGSRRPRPTGSFDGRRRGLFADPKVQAALKACGITLPTGRPAGSAGPTG
jgi:hypothetical protein